MFEVVFSLIVVAFSFITTKYSKNIFTPIKHWSDHSYGKKIFAFISTIRSHSFIWFLTGKALEELGSNTNSTIIKITGKALVAPSSFVISNHYKIPVFSKATQGFLLSIKPFELLNFVFTNDTLPNNQLRTSAIKGLKWGARDGIEIILSKTIMSEFTPRDKLLVFVATEFRFSLGIKTIMRERYEQKLLDSWSENCPKLETQTIYIIANALYPLSLDPIFDYLKNIEESLWAYIFNVTLPTQNSSLHAFFDEVEHSESNNNLPGITLQHPDL